MAENEEIFDGKVTGITAFGAFVQITDGRTGLVHISEVSDQYVKEIKDYLQEGQAVKVIVMSSLQEGKLRLSIKKAVEIMRRNGELPEDSAAAPDRAGGFQKKPQKNFVKKPAVKTEPFDPSVPPVEFDDYGNNEKAGAAFEDKLSSFMKSSEEKLSALKKQTENKRGGGYVRRG